MSLDFEDEPKQAVEVIDPNVDTSQRVNASDKRMINATTDVNQLVPFKYKWAWQMYLDSCNNHWMPQEYKMETDAQQLTSGKITAGELAIIERTLGALAHNDLASGKITLDVYRHITAPEARQYLLRQGFEEALVPHTYSHILSTLKLDEDAIIERHADCQTWHDKRAFLATHLDILNNPDFKTGTIETDQQLVKAILAYFCIAKNIFSVVDFTQVLSLSLQNKMPELVQQYRNLLRDQMTQATFGAEVIQAIRAENPQLWTAEFTDELKRMVRDAVLYETTHATVNSSLAMLQSSMAGVGDLLVLVGNRLAVQIGLGPILPTRPNPMPWMAEALGLQEVSKSLTPAVAENKVSTTLEWE